MVAESGDFNGTEVNSDNQLWSVAANLSVAFRIIFGLEYESDRLAFKPFIPERYKGSYVLNSLKYRQTVLDITIDGFGDGIASFELDGVKAPDDFIAASLTGHHEIRIVMNGKTGDEVMNLSGSRFTPATPEPVIASGQIVWKPVTGAVTYDVFRNGRHLSLTADTAYNLEESAAGEYQVQAIDADGFSSFLSKPLQYDIYENSIIIEAEAFAGAHSMTLFGYSGTGYAELRKESPDYAFSIDVPADGDYVIEFRYSNGSGPVNTDNKCAQRSLFCNGNYAGSAIFPQRGRDEWSNWGLSNPLTVSLTKGSNKMVLRLEEYNNNMNVDVNTFMLDFIRCFPSDAVK